jgi:23S rRNA pseudouridine1911/1915/1917 synthase
MAPGDEITIVPRAPVQAPAASVVHRTGDYVFLAKPAGLHTVRLEGGGAPNLEESLAALCPELPRPPRLLQRLDFETSGLVCAATSEAAVDVFKKEERQGRCVKGYVALLSGRLEAPATAKAALKTANRRKTRILDLEAPPLRWTKFTPLAVLGSRETASLLGESASQDPGAAPEDGVATLALCTLLCGARHQVRIHAASLGHPLLGDPLYGPGPTDGPAGYPADRPDAATGRPSAHLLHQAFVAFPQAACVLSPPWPLPASAMARMEGFLDIAPSWDILAAFAPATPEGVKCSRR